MGYDRKKLGRYLKQSRQKAGLSQKIVSERLGLQTAQYISNIERGLCAVPIDTLKKLIQLYSEDSLQVIKMMASTYSKSLKAYFLRR
ncbi:MAG: helix-turn-helix domain-containing protein [Bdellovibrionales bacterium]